MNEGKKNFFSAWLGLFDRALFFGVIASHAIILFEPIRAAFDKKFSAETGLIIYVILMTVFWSYFTINYSSKHVKDITVENKRLQEENSICRKNFGYIDAYTHIGLGFSLIHQMQRNIPQIDPSSEYHEDQLALLIMQFEEMCLHVADGFKSIAGQNDFSVCVKLVNGKEITRGSSVRTFVRDSKNVGRNYEENGSTHLIENNTSYSEIVKKMSKGQGGRCFISNDLPQLKGYLNTTFPIYGQDEYNDALTPEERNNNWQLPYKSTIVTGIYPNQKQYYKDKYLIGFLCVDSNQIDIFDKKHDPLILTGVADGIYNTLKSFNQLTQKTRV